MRKTTFFFEQFVFGQLISLSELNIISKAVKYWDSGRDSGR
jgi:hypothetical protein